jgi:hypothetical protein
MTIFGITGAIGHGKSTLAEALGQVEPQSIHLESFTVIAEVVQAWHAQTASLPDPHDLAQVNNWLTILPPILAQVVHVQVDPAKLVVTLDDITARPDLYEKLFTHMQNLHDNKGLLTSQVNEATKDQYRPILQWIGGYMVTCVDPGIWYNEMMRRAKQAGEEGIQLCTIGGVRFPSDADIVHQGGGYIVHIVRPLLGETDIADPTERERIHIHPDITIINDAGLLELVKVAQRMYADIQLGRLKSRYDATGI